MLLEEEQRTDCFQHPLWEVAALGRRWPGHPSTYHVWALGPHILGMGWEPRGVTFLLGTLLAPHPWARALQAGLGRLPGPSAWCARSAPTPHSRTLHTRRCFHWPTFPGPELVLGSDPAGFDPHSERVLRGSQSWCGCGNRRLPSPGGPLLRVLVDSRFDPSSPVQFLIFTIQTRTLSLRGGGCSPAVGTLLAPPCPWGSSLNYRPRAAPARSSPQLCSPTEQGGCPEG